MIEYTVAKTRGDLQQILVLQSTNLPVNISTEEAKDQGFVTVHHHYDLLESMNQPHPHIIAKAEGQVVGYTLVMLPEFGRRIPVLLPMFDKINQLIYEGIPLRESGYFVMGQVCVAKAFRGKGVFAGLYQKMKEKMSIHFKYILTEIATRNTRSMRAHQKVGFKTIHCYKTDSEEWAIVLWDWS